MRFSGGRRLGEGGDVGVAAHEVLQHFAAVRVSASTVWRRTEPVGEQLLPQPTEGRTMQPTQADPGSTASREDGRPVAYVRSDAFSVPINPLGQTEAVPSRRNSWHDRVQLEASQK